MSATCLADDLEQEDLEVTPDEARKALADTDLFLGDAFKIERMGVIRPGIRVPKRDCPQDLVALYGRLVEEGKTWDEIDAQLGLDPQKKSWLTPRNVDFFWVGRGDCHADPSHAELIRKLYADRDGKIRKINIRFPFDDINRMIAVKLSCYTSAGLRYVGRFHSGRLMCEDMATSNTSNEQREKKAQVFSRKRILKPCIPDQCDFYQEKACRMHGGFIFSIPGVPGLGVWAIYTRSAHNSMVYIRTMLQKIEGLARDYCGLSGIPGDLFHLKKIRGKVSSDGRRQYLITISSNHDVDQVERILAEKYPRKNVVAPAAVARKPIVRAVRPAAVPQGVDPATGEILREGAEAALGNKPAGPSDAGGQPNASAASGSQPNATAPQEPKQETTTPRKASPQPGQDNGAAPRKEGQGRNAENGAGDYDARLISFMKNELMKHSLLAGVTKVNIVKGVEKISTEILEKSAKKASGVEVDRLIGTIKARLEKRDATAFTQGNGSGGSAPVQKQGPTSTQDAPAVDSLSGDWPEGAAEAPGSPSTPKAAQQETSSSASRPGPDDPFVGLSVQIAPFLRGAMKNPLFARVQGSFRRVMDSYSARSFGKELAKLSPEEIGKFMNAVAGALAKKDVDAIIGNVSQDGPQQSAPKQRANTAA